jgi:hypothetical protein
MKVITATILAVMISFSSMAQHGGGHGGGGHWGHDCFRGGFRGPGWGWGLGWGLGLGLGLGYYSAYSYPAYSYSYPAYYDNYVYTTPSPVYAQPAYPDYSGPVYSSQPAADPPAFGTATVTAGSAQYPYPAVQNVPAPEQPAVKVYLPANSYSYTPAPAQPVHTPVTTVTRSKAGYLIYDNR